MFWEKGEKAEKRGRQRIGEADFGLDTGVSWEVT